MPPASFAGFASPPAAIRSWNASIIPMTVPSRPSSGPRLPMMFRYSILRNWSAVCSATAVSIASFIDEKLGARFSAGLSARLTKLGSVSVNSISSLNSRRPIRSRM